MSWCSSSQQATLQWLQQAAPAGSLWVAYSGGLDSTVLLHWLVNSPLHARVKAIHVHHGLSPNADAWADHCQHLCAEWRVPFELYQVDLAAQHSGLEEAARNARYAVFADVLQAGDALLLGHHQDDQLETFAQRWIRGSGVHGLAAMRRQRSFAQAELLRPLLSCSREELHRYATEHALSWIEDESNTDICFTRNWWRNVGLPPIWQQFPHAKRSAARTVQRLQQDADVLTLLLQQQLLPLTEVSLWPGTLATCLRLDQLRQQPDSLHSYLVRLWWQQNNLPNLTDARLQDLLASVTGAADRQPAGELGEWRWQRHQQQLYVYRPQAVPDAWKLSGEQQQTISWAGGQLGLHGRVPEGAQVIPAKALQQRTFKPYGRPTRPLKKWWQSWQVPVWLRPLWPVLVDNEDQALAFASVGSSSCVAVELDHKIDFRWCR
ncbi:tRNA lysidine(34) synthetase TilS [Bacterioplanes sanyensis]|uniref:tRNA(Ile)-lysidine synthase n=1 Tax=Bacterioplanes sanyensis TaxID=1249553 RepID=A0A222FQN6_9GAMM|nr:tRNA lysidine(34) synthetase TilS [Bacterioplanes sanyensis]ASP40543.1 tRNA lysidine(34) synthetase TilS [Bacterioplanes sanyensis]